MLQVTPGRAYVGAKDESSSVIDERSEWKEWGEFVLLSVAWIPAETKDVCYTNFGKARELFYSISRFTFLSNWLEWCLQNFNLQHGIICLLSLHTEL